MMEVEVVPITLLNLPDHILEKIFGYLPFRDKLLATRLCRHSYEIIGKSLSLMRNVCVVWKGSERLTPDQFNRLDQFFNCMLRTRRKYQILKIEGKFFDTFLNVMEKFGDSLKKLDITDTKINMNQLTEIFQLAPNLEDIFCETDLEVGDSSYRQIIEGPNLKRFKYRGPWINMDQFRFKKLGRLDLQFKTISTPEDITNLRNFMNRLEKLRCMQILSTVEMEQFLTAEFVKDLKLNTLTDIEVRSVSQIKDLGLANLILNQTNLEKINLYFLKPTRDDSEYTTNLMEAITSREKLRHLQMFFVTFSNFKLTFRKPLAKVEFFEYYTPSRFEITEKSHQYIEQIHKFIRFMPNLKTLKLSSRVDFEKEDFVFLNPLKNLEMLELSIRTSPSVLKHLHFKFLKSVTTIRTNKGFPRELDSIDDDDLHEFLANHPKLENVVLSDFPRCQRCWKHIINMNFIKKIEFNIHECGDNVLKTIKTVEKKYGVEFKKRFRKEVDFWTINLDF